MIVFISVLIVVLTLELVLS